jgi:hypothetical protein
MSNELNPYAAPADISLPVIKPPLPKASSWGATYESARGRAYLAMFFSAGYLMAALCIAVAMYGQIQLLERGLRGEQITAEAAEFNDNLLRSLSVAAIGAALLGGLFFLMWVYAAHKNLPALGTPHPQFTPGWAVGWFFIPIMNFFKPCQAIMELAEGSDPGRVAEAAALRRFSERAAGGSSLFQKSAEMELRELGGRTPKGTALIVVWWVWRIAGFLVARLLTGPTDSQSMPVLLNFSWVVLIAIFLTDVPMALLQIMVVRRIDNDQEDRHRLTQFLAAQSAREPSPPLALAVDGTADQLPVINP